MSDKKKIDEAAILNVSTSSDGMTGDTTFVADDIVGLAALLKRAGLQSSQFNGPATLSVEVQDQGSSVTSRVMAPDLRSIMTLLEPEFQQAGDAEPVEDPEMAAKRSKAHSDIDNAFNSGTVAGAELYDPGMDPYGTMEPGSPVLDTGANSQFSVAVPQYSADNDGTVPNMADNTLEIEPEVDEAEIPQIDRFAHDNEYDARNDLDDEYGMDLPKPGDAVVIDGKSGIIGAESDQDIYGGPASFEVQYEDGSVGNHTVDTILYGDSSYDEGLEEEADFDYRDHSVEPQPYAGLTNQTTVQPRTKDTPARSSDNPLEEGSASFDDTEEGAIMALDHMSSYNVEGATAIPDPQIPGVWLVTHNEGRSIVYLNKNDFEDIDEAVRPKTFSDYIREAELNELSRGTVNRYVTSVNQDDYETADHKKLLKRGKGLGHAQSKIHWKDANVLATEEITTESLINEFKLNELSSELKDRYIDKARISKSDHEKKAADLEDLSWDAEKAAKMGAMRSDAPARVRKWQRPHDHTAYKREKGLDRLGALDEEDLDEVSRNDWQSKISQYGRPYYLNTDCGYASLEGIMQGEGLFDDIPAGLAAHATKVGVTVLEIERNGKKGFNYVNSVDNLAPGTPVTCVTQTSTGSKYRPGRFITSFSTKDLSTNYDQVVAELAKLGITPSKKLSVKTFD